MTYLQNGKNELKDYVKASGLKVIESLEETSQKRVLGVLVQRQGEALDLLDCVQVKTRPEYAEKTRKITLDGIVLSPVLPALFALGATVFTLICVLSAKPQPEGAAPDLRWLYVLLFSLLTLGQSVYHLVRKAGAKRPQAVKPSAEAVLDTDAAKLKLEKQLSRLMSDSEALCCMFHNQKLEGAGAYEDELVKLFASLYEAKVDRPDCEEFSYSLTLAEMMLRQLGLRTVPYSEENSRLFNIETEDYHDEMRTPAVVRAKTGEVVRKGEYIRNIAQYPA